MYKTRNIFVFHGLNADVRKGLSVLRFKGTVTLVDQEISEDSIQKAFDDNKSVLCAFYHGGSLPSKFADSAFHLMVGTDSNLVGFCTINVSRLNIIEQFQSFATTNHLDIGDHITNSSGLKGTPSPSECAYCNFLLGKNPYSHQVVYKSTYFYVMATLGAFVPGYMLLIPFRHVTSLAELSSEEFAELPTVIEDISSLLTYAFDCEHLLIFENGSGNGGKGKAKDSVVHSHLHFVPSNLTSSKISEISGFRFETIHTDDIRKYGSHSYLLIKDETPNTWLINNEHSLYIPRQYVRQLIAAEYGIPGERWNWRKYGFTNLMERSTKQIASALFNNSDIYSPRILERTYKLIEHYYG